jgi:hypothetical protein
MDVNEHKNISNKFTLRLKLKKRNSPCVAVPHFTLTV